MEQAKTQRGQEPAEAPELETMIQQVQLQTEQIHSLVGELVTRLGWPPTPSVQEAVSNPRTGYVGVLTGIVGNLGESLEALQACSA